MIDINNNNNNNNIKEKACLFATNAHKDQVRKSEPIKPFIIHPINVAKILEEYGYDDNVISAGYLHDVIEDTKYTYEDILKEFGEDIADIVKCASESDKSLSWEQRKDETIKNIKTLPLRKKLVICADKINNIEDLYLKFKCDGKKDYSAFNRGEEKQKWYHTNVYNSLITNSDENLPIFKRYKNAINNLFNENNELNISFNDDEKYLNIYSILDARKEELLRIKNLCLNNKPFVVELTGTPRSGKTISINNIEYFFNKSGFRTKIINEYTTSSDYKKIKKDLNKISSGDKNIIIQKNTYNQLINNYDNNYDIILLDRSINDRNVWNFLQFLKGNISKEKFSELIKTYSKYSDEYIDLIAVFYANCNTSVKRDYKNNITLAKNIDNINLYNNALLNMYNYSFENNKILIDTDRYNLVDSGIILTDKIIENMRNEYLKTFKKEKNIRI